MEIPSSDGGVVKSVTVSIGDMVKQGDTVITLELADATDTKSAEPEAEAAQEARPLLESRYQLQQAQPKKHLHQIHQAQVLVALKISLSPIWATLMR